MVNHHLSFLESRLMSTIWLERQVSFKDKHRNYTMRETYTHFDKCVISSPHNYVTVFQVKLRREKYQKEQAKQLLLEARERVHGRMAAEAKLLFCDRPKFVVPVITPYSVSILTWT